jgi:hypothetical protein
MPIEGGPKLPGRFEMLSNQCGVRVDQTPVTFFDGRREAPMQIGAISLQLRFVPTVRINGCPNTYSPLTVNAT